MAAAGLRGQLPAVERVERESCIAAGFLRAAALDVADGGSGKTDRDADRGVGHSCGAQGLDSG